MEAAKKRLEGRYFVSFDQYIDGCQSGADWLKNEEIAQLVTQSLHFGHDIYYNLHAYCVMPNHVHVLLTVLREDVPFYKVLQRLKTYTAVQANRLLNRTGQSFWQAESYDHAVRNEKSFKRIVNYILHNPIKAGLVINWEDWPYSYYQAE
ncbi:REP-associated tyrosine transposase [Spirosoma litoris]